MTISYFFPCSLVKIAKSVSRLPPKLKTKLYQSRAKPSGAVDQPPTDDSHENLVSSSQNRRVPPHSLVNDSVGQLETSAQKLEQEGDLSPKNVNARKADDSMLMAVPEVAHAIDQIANYFGSTQPSLEESSGAQADQLVIVETESVPHNQQKNNVEIPTPSEPEVGSLSSLGGDVGNDGNPSSSTSIGLLSHETIGRLAGEIAEQIAGASLVRPDDKEVNVPSYAPEKCSAHDSGYTEGLTTVQPIQGVALLPDQEGATDICMSVGIGDVKKLNNILVTEKDIFGSPCKRDDFSDGVDIICEPCDMSLEVTAVDDKGCKVYSAGSEGAMVDSGEAEGDGGRNSPNGNSAMDIDFDGDPSSSPGSSHGETCVVEAGSGCSKNLSDDKFIEADCKGGEATVEGSVSVDGEVNAGLEGGDGIYEAGDGICEDGYGNGGKQNASIDGTGDIRTGHTVEDKRTMEEFQKLTSMADDILVAGKIPNSCYQSLIMLNHVI